VGGSLQMGLHMPRYLFLGENIETLYKEVCLSYILSDHDNPGNHPIYAVDDEIGSSIFHINDDVHETSSNKLIGKQAKDMENSMWNFFLMVHVQKKDRVLGL
jgi:hypothetical protein